MSIKDIEKENLEAHVELCSERYKSLHDKLDAVNLRLDKHETMLVEVHAAVISTEKNRNNQLIAWGAGTIAVLVSTIGTLMYIILT
jgi:hypothetical protein|tara:strand:+ start:2589 stop:2846 length:258 start_codon:yes stop_codon:yes gene_type:complete